MNLHFIRSSEKKQFVEKLNEQFGIEELPYLLIESGKEKIRGFSGHLSKDEIAQLGQLLWIEGVGTYLLRKEVDGLRLSFDATQILQSQIKKNIIEINEEEFQKWIRGNDLQKQAPRGIVIISHNGDFLGCGKSTGENIINHVPKERRLKK